MKMNFKVVKGNRDQTLNRLINEPWMFTNEEMDRLLFNFYNEGALTRGECWEILVKRVEHKASSAEDLRTRLEGRLLMAVALDDRSEKERVSFLLEKLKQTGISG